MAHSKRKFDDMNLKNQYPKYHQHNAFDMNNNIGDDLEFFQPQMMQQSPAQHHNPQVAKSHNYALANLDPSNQYPNKRHAPRVPSQAPMINLYNPQLHPTSINSQDTQNMMRQTDRSTISSFEGHNGLFQDSPANRNAFMAEQFHQRGQIANSHSGLFSPQPQQQMQQNPGNIVSSEGRPMKLLYHGMNTPAITYAHPMSLTQPRTPSQQSAGQMHHIDNFNPYVSNVQGNAQRVHPNNMNKRHIQTSTPYLHPSQLSGYANMQRSTSGAPRGGMGSNMRTTASQGMVNLNSQSFPQQQSHTPSQSYSQNMRHSTLSSQQTFDPFRIDPYHNDSAMFHNHPMTTNQNMQARNGTPTHLDPSLWQVAAPYSSEYQTSNIHHNSNPLTLGGNVDVLASDNTQSWPNTSEDVLAMIFGQDYLQTGGYGSQQMLDVRDMSKVGSQQAQPLANKGNSQQLQSFPEQPLAYKNKFQEHPQNHTANNPGRLQAENTNRPSDLHQTLPQNQAPQLCTQKKPSSRTTVPSKTLPLSTNATSSPRTVSRNGSKRTFSETTVTANEEVQSTKKLKLVPSLVDMDWSKAFQLPEEKLDGRIQMNDQRCLLPDDDWLDSLQKSESDLNVIASEETQKVADDVPLPTMPTEPLIGNETPQNEPTVPGTSLDQSLWDTLGVSSEPAGQNHHKQPATGIAGPAGKPSRPRKNTNITTPKISEPEAKNKKRKRSTPTTTTSRKRTSRVSPALKQPGYYDNTLSNSVLDELLNSEFALGFDKALAPERSDANTRDQSEVGMISNSIIESANMLPTPMTDLSENATLPELPSFHDIPGMNPTLSNYDPCLVHPLELESPEGRKAAFERSLAAVFAANPTCRPSPSYEPSRLNMLADFPTHGKGRRISGPLLRSPSPTPSTLEPHLQQNVADSPVMMKDMENNDIDEDWTSFLNDSPEDLSTQQFDPDVAAQAVTADAEQQRVPTQESTTDSTNKEPEALAETDEDREAVIDTVGGLDTVDLLDAQGAVDDGQDTGYIPSSEERPPDYQLIKHPDTFSTATNTDMDVNSWDHLFAGSPDQYSEETESEEHDNVIGDIEKWCDLPDAETTPAEEEALRRLLTLNGTTSLPSSYERVDDTDDDDDYAFEKLPRLQDPNPKVASKTNIRDRITC